jgi:putative methionine-R-sulfoxide reductase with GAF domain
MNSTPLQSRRGQYILKGMSDDQILLKIEELVNSDVPLDQVLRRAIELIKRSRDYYDWVGIYLLEGEFLVLASYIGEPTEHVRIPVGVGVCGTAVATRSNQIIGDVTKVDNYLACSPRTRSEIVVLIRRGDSIFGQIDIDSDRERAFDERDEAMLSRAADLLAHRFK